MPPWFQIGRRSPSCESRAAGFSRRSGGGGCGRQGEGGGWRGGQEAGGRRRGMPRTPSSSPRRLAGRLVAPPRPHLLCTIGGAASASIPASCFLRPWHHSCRSTPSSSILTPLSATVARTSLVWAGKEGHGESCASRSSSRGWWSV
ncbi:hypothetical protein VPH35_086719 [Triticum aestivum]